MSKLKGILYIVGGALLFILGAVVSGMVLLGRAKSGTRQNLRAIRDGAKSAGQEANRAGEAIRSGRDINRDLQAGNKRYKRLIEKGRAILASGTYHPDP